MLLAGGWLNCTGFENWKLGWKGYIHIYTYCILPYVQVTWGKHNMAQHNTKVCKTWRARQCVYVTFSYSLCSGSHLLLHLQPNNDQLFSTLVYRNSEVEVLLYCLFRLRTCQVHCMQTRGSKNAVQLKHHGIKVGVVGDCTLNFLQMT